MGGERELAGKPAQPGAGSAGWSPPEPGSSRAGTTGSGSRSVDGHRVAAAAVVSGTAPAGDSERRPKTLAATCPDPLPSTDSGQPHTAPAVRTPDVSPCPAAGGPTPGTAGGRLTPGHPRRRRVWRGRIGRRWPRFSPRLTTTDYRHARSASQGSSSFDSVSMRDLDIDRVEVSLGPGSRRAMPAWTLSSLIIQRVRESRAPWMHRKASAEGASQNSPLGSAPEPPLAGSR